ncbi:protein SSUH2 homolog [Carettochelys insculpta]|uniref:protein SSUH2 homolog n=1 Tax=Carettochelys insculpta TaxID=44489 RepID=UPI003EB78DC0
MAAEGQTLSGSRQSYGAVDQTSYASTKGPFGAVIPDHVTNGEEPSAPPAYAMDDVSGYEGTALGDGGGKHLPPPSNLVTDRGGGHHPPAQTHWNIPSVSEGEAREALIQYAARKCCYSSAPAKEMVFRTLQPFNTYRYRLETFTESRSSEWKTTPYRGEFVDSFLTGPAPLPWDIQVEVPAMFTDSITRVKVPHTSSLKGCHSCHCSGTVRCTKCHGKGKVQCWICDGSGKRMSNDRCTHCNGSGRSRCTSCSGSGHKTCKTCAGRGQLLYYIELQVKWQNNIFEYVADQRSGFPADLFKEVTGQKMFVDEQSMVTPVVNFPDASISQASQNAVVQHHTQFASTSRLLRQRHTIELIPVTKVEYEWQGKLYSYYVYGDENKVYAENYPKKCCCSIM